MGARLRSSEVLLGSVPVQSVIGAAILLNREFCVWMASSRAVCFPHRDLTLRGSQATAHPQMQNFTGPFSAYEDLGAMSTIPAPLLEWREAPRVRSLNGHSVRPKGRYVLCWLQQALRSHDNPVIDAAILLGNDLGSGLIDHSQ